MKIYSTTQKESFFKNCKPYEELRFRALYEPAFRKKELIYLEKEDVLRDRQMLRVQSKARYDENGNLLYKFKAKANSEREVPISKELMERIVAHMNDSASSIGKEVVIAEMNKQEKAEKPTASRPDSRKTAKVMLNEPDAVTVTGTPAL